MKAIKSDTLPTSVRGLDLYNQKLRDKPYKLVYYEGYHYFTPNKYYDSGEWISYIKTNDDKPKNNSRSFEERRKFYKKRADKSKAIKSVKHIMNNQAPFKPKDQWSESFSAFDRAMADDRK